MKNEQIKSICEAVLFACGEPVELTRLTKVTQESEEAVAAALDELINEYTQRESGICILKLGDKYQMCSRTDIARFVREALDLKKNAPLSNAALEVLAVVAYNQPVTKAYIEQIRGVDCSGVLSTLCQKDLICEKGRLELPGRPLLYGTTDNFLRCFCLGSLADLPELEEKRKANKML